MEEERGEARGKEKERGEARERHSARLGRISGEGYTSHRF